MADGIVSSSRLRELLRYDPETGEFFWRTKHGSKVRPGAAAGYLDPARGYLILRIDGKGYRSHRLAFLYMTGVMPTDQVDHRDGVPTNNRWSNLRVATAGENSRNRKPGRSNSSGITGVLWNERSMKWRATIKKNGLLRHLGYFDSVDEAATVRRAAEVDEFKEFAPSISRA